MNLTTIYSFFFFLQGLRNDFVRNIMWTFEDIHMLVGSNMPIFGGGRYPAVSLKLRLKWFSNCVSIILSVDVAANYFVAATNLSSDESEIRFRTLHPLLNSKLIILA